MAQEPSNKLNLTLSDNDGLIAMDVDITLKRSDDGSRLLADKVFAPTYLLLESSAILNLPDNDYLNNVIQSADMTALNQIAEQLNKNPTSGGDITIPTTDGDRILKFGAPRTKDDWTNPSFAHYDHHIIGPVTTASPTTARMLEEYLNAGSESQQHEILSIDSTHPIDKPERQPVALLLASLAEIEKETHGLESDDVTLLWPLVKERIDNINSIKKLSNIVSSFTNVKSGSFDDMLTQLENNSQYETINDMLMTPFISESLKVSARDYSFEFSGEVSAFYQVQKQDVSHSLERKYGARISMDNDGTALVRDDNVLIAFASPSEYEAEQLLVAPRDYPINAHTLVHFETPEPAPDIEFEGEEPDINPEEDSHLQRRR